MADGVRRLARILKTVPDILRSGSASLFAGLMLGNAVAYAYQMLMARMMLPADYGSLVTLTSIWYVLAVVVLTVEARLIKAASTARDAGHGQIHAVFSVAMRTLVSLGGIVFAVHWIASKWVARFFHLGATTPVILLGLYASSAFLVPVARGVLLGLNRLHIAGAVQFLEPVARLVAGTILVTLGLGVNGALIGYVVGSSLAFVIAVVALWPLLHQSHSGSSISTALGVLDRYALLILLINAGLMIISSIDQIAVKHFFSAEVAGNYSVAFVLGRMIVMSAISLGKVVLARSAAIRSDDPRSARLLTRGLLVTLVIALSLTVCFLVAPKLFVRMMGGGQYSIADAYVGLVGIEMTLFALVYIQVYYQISMMRLQAVWTLCLAATLGIALLARYHATVQQVLMNLIFVMGGLLVCVSGLSWRFLRTDGHPKTTMARTFPGPDR